MFILICVIGAQWIFPNYHEMSKFGFGEKGMGGVPGLED